PRGPGQSARGRLGPRRHPLGDDTRRGPAVRPRGDLRGDHPRPRTGGRRDDGGHHDDREPQRDFHLPLRPGTDHRELDREQLPERHRPAGAERPHRTGTRPHADVAPHQRLRATDAGPGPPTRGGRRVMFRFDRDTRRRWKDVAMNVAAFLCVVLALIPLGSLLLRAGSSGIVRQRLVFITTTGVIALSTIMIPFIARTSEEALRLVPISTRESALALGIPRYRAILRVVLPSSSSAVITGALLG